MNLFRNIAAHLTEKGAAPEPTPLAFLDTTDPAFQSGLEETIEVAIVMCIVIALIGCIWFGISRLPRTKSGLSKQKQILLARIVGIIAVIGVGSVSLDLWWHRAVGRDMFWEPPHLGLYFMAVTAILLSLWAWHKTRSSPWKAVAITLLLIPIAAPFDQLWHTIFGVEDFSQPHLLIWSPPHLVVAFSATFCQIFLLPLLYKDTNADFKALMGILIFGTLTATSFYLMLPVHPTDGFGQLFGFWGVGLMSTWIVGLPLIGRVWLNDKTAATKLLAFSIAMLLFAYGKETDPDVIMLAHDRMPNWVIILTLFTTGAWIDSTDRVSPVVRCTIGGCLASIVMFGTTRHFIDPAFFYSNAEVGIAILSGTIGGLAASYWAEALCRKTLKSGISIA